MMSGEILYRDESYPFRVLRVFRSSSFRRSNP